MLDFTKLIHASITLDQQISQDRNIIMKPQESLTNAYVALDVELAEVANTAEWFKVWKTHRGKATEGKTKQETLLEEYADALDFFLLIGAKQQWTHLIVMDRDAVKRLKDQKSSELNKQYLMIKKMVYGSYFDHRQADFEHAWHLFLKIGLVDFGFSEDDIMKAYQKKSAVNYQRQANDY